MLLAWLLATSTAVGAQPIYALPQQDGGADAPTIYGYDLVLAPTTPPANARGVAFGGFDRAAAVTRLRTRVSGFVLAAKGAPHADDVADDFVVVRGGTKDMPPPGEVFSGAAGRTLEEAASGVPHGQIRATTARAIREAGGTVRHAPELTRSGVMNPLHVNVCLGRGRCPFGELFPNPVPNSGRIR